MKFGKQTFLWVAVILLSGVVGVEALAIWWFKETYNPSVITDSSKKRFDPTKFQFGQYTHIARNEREFTPALRKMFPPGTDKTYVDQILVKQAHANASAVELTKYHDEGDSDYSYIYGTWQVRFIFDKNNKTKMMKTGEVLHYGQDPKTKFWEDRGYERKQ